MYQIHTHFLDKYVPKDACVLDAGCGPGCFSLDLVRRNARLTLVDLSKMQLELARQHLSEVGLLDKVEAFHCLDLFEGGDILAECLGAAGYHIAPMPVAAQASVLQRLSGHQNLHTLNAQSDHHEEKITARLLMTLDTFPEHLQDTRSARAVLALVGQVHGFLPSRTEAGPDQSH